MQRVTIRSRVDSEGMIRVAVPAGVSAREQEVDVTIQSVGHRRMTPIEWQKFVDSTAGCITDPLFTRHAEGEFERREVWP